MNPMYAKQMIQMAEENKQSLNIRKEIILDDDTTDEQLGAIIRMMYRAKEKENNDLIERCKKELK